MCATGCSSKTTATPYAGSLPRAGLGRPTTSAEASEKRNLEIVETVCAILDQSCPNDPVLPHQKLISFVKDRPGHDRRYAIDARKIEREFGWKPRESFESGIRKTIEWYLQNEEWVKRSHQRQLPEVDRHPVLISLRACPGEAENRPHASHYLRRHRLTGKGADARMERR